MQMIKRATNGNYAKLLEATIVEYHEQKQNLNTVRGWAKTVTTAKLLAAFYSIPILLRESEDNEETWVQELRTKKLQHSVYEGGFLEAHVVLYLMGAIAFMLEDSQSSDKQLEDFAQLDSIRVTTTGLVRSEEVHFLRELWMTGYCRQQARFVGN